MENKFFGQNLVQLRKERHLSQSDLASHINVTTSAISKWENNKNMPDIEMLKILSKFFEISLSELLGTPEIDFQEEIPPELVPETEPEPVKETSKRKTLSNPIITGVIAVVIIVLVAVAFGIHSYTNQQATIPFRVMNSRTVEDPVWNETITEIGVYYEGTLDNDLISMVSYYIKSQWREGKIENADSIETIKIYFYNDKSSAKDISPEADSYLFLFDKE